MPLTDLRPLGLALMLPFVAMTGQPAAAQEEPRFYTMATADEGGTYYPVGVAMAVLAKISLESLYGIDMEAVVSGGSIDNIRMMREGEAQFGILQVLAAEWARDGTGPLAEVDPSDSVRAVTMLWPDVAHFLLRSDLVETGTLEDLANLEGQGFSMGPANSSTEYTNVMLFDVLELSYQDWNPVNESYSDSVQSLPEGRIAGVNIGAGVGVEAVSLLLATMGEGLELLTVTDAQAEHIEESLGSVSRVSIVGGTYAGVEDVRQTIALPNFLAVNADVSAEDVYLITRTLFENLEYLCEVHQAACGLSVETATEGLPVDLHPGAARYFRELAEASDDAEAASE